MRLPIKSALVIAAALATGGAYAQSDSQSQGQSSQSSDQQAGQQGETGTGGSGQTSKKKTSKNTKKSTQQQQAGQGGSGQQDPQQRAQNQATMHIATVNASLQSATTTAAMLKELSQNPQTIDKTHAQTLVTNLREDLRQASAHLNELKSVSTSTGKQDQKQQQNLQQLTQNVQQAQQTVSKMQQQYSNPQQLNQSASSVYDQLKGTPDTLKDVASAMNVNIDLNPKG